jgi:Protein of unknown function (DUF2778)
MRDTTATFHDITFGDGRTFRPGKCRRAVRFLVGGVVIGAATVAAVAALVTTVMVAAAWIINTGLAANSQFNAQAPIGPAAIALAGHYPAFAGAADITGSVPASIYLASADPVVSDRASSDPAEALTFEAKWAGATAPDPTPTEAIPLVPQQPVEPVSKVASLPPAREAAPPIAAAAPEKRAPPQQAHNKSVPLPAPDSHIAVYDIAAHTVYLPNGSKLEAHSGLGDKLDDPRYVSLRDRGPTPPNVYDLVLREQPFHEVRALRLNPVGGDSMFGRDGILAHSYMLGANGQSNGCVSFKDYPAFLHAYLRGEVDRLVVVAHLGNTSWRTASDGRGPDRQYAANNP